MSRHILCGILQPHDANIRLEANPLLYSNLQDEDELGSFGLGERVVVYMLHSLIIFPQNENVNHAHTSQRRVADLRRPDRRTHMKVLVEKTFNFVNTLWRSYIRQNSTDLRYVSYTV